MYSKITKSTAMLLAVLFFHLAWISASHADVTITYVNLGAGGTALLRVPSPLGGTPRDHIGIFVMHPSSPFINSPICTELANRGYQTLCADNPFSFNGDAYKGYEDHSAIIARGINCLKGITPPGIANSPCTSIVGITKIIIIGHSMGGPMMAFYQNIAENGAATCQRPERLIPCDPTNLSNLPKADGVILLDSHLGDAFSTMTYTDPAVVREAQPGVRNPNLDLFDPRNGFDPNLPAQTILGTPTTGGATYSDKFVKAFLAGQSKRHNKLVDEALHELRDIESGRGHLYPDDMPFVVPGTNGARLWQHDTRFLKCTQGKYLLLTAANPLGEGPQIICSVRLPQPNRATALSFASVTNVSVRVWLGAHAVRTTEDYNQTPNDITGIVFESSNTSTPTNVEGITKPLLIVVMGAHYFMRPDEIILEHAMNTNDKTMVAVAGASHVFTPCTACEAALGVSFGDTVKRLFDFIDTWLTEPERF
jgi:pimeloyl-ACP methyl ester carboxylesterase